jgi:ribosomal protein L1
MTQASKRLKKEVKMPKKRGKSVRECILEKIENKNLLEFALTFENSDLRDYLHQQAQIHGTKD